MVYLYSTTLLNTSTKYSAFLYWTLAVLSKMHRSSLPNISPPFMAPYVPGAPLNLSANVDEGIFHGPLSGLLLSAPVNFPNIHDPYKNTRSYRFSQRARLDFITECSVCGGIDPQHTITFVHYIKIKCIFPDFPSHTRTWRQQRRMSSMSILQHFSKLTGELSGACYEQDDTVWRMEI